MDKAGLLTHLPAGVGMALWAGVASATESARAMVFDIAIVGDEAMYTDGGMPQELDDKIGRIIVLTTQTLAGHSFNIKMAP